MGRKHSFHDREFGRANYDPSDEGTYIPNLVTVAMPFQGTDWDEIYDVIKSKCAELGLKAQRVDEFYHSGIVVLDIARAIEQAEFIIFDLSCERPNVYYELGYAHGVGNEADEILLIAKEGTILHYDIAALRVHFYKSAEHLSSILNSKLTDMITEGR